MHHFVRFVWPRIEYLSLARTMFRQGRLHHRRCRPGDGRHTSRATAWDAWRRWTVQFRKREVRFCWIRGHCSYELGCHWRRTHQGVSIASTAWHSPVDSRSSCCSHPIASDSPISILDTCGNSAVANWRNSLPQVDFDQAIVRNVCRTYEALEEALRCIERFSP